MLAFDVLVTLSLISDILLFSTIVSMKTYVHMIIKKKYLKFNFIRILFTVGELPPPSSSIVSYPTPLLSKNGHHNK